MNPNLLTSGQFATATGVAPRTISIWADQWFDFCKEQSGNGEDVLTPHKLEALRSDLRDHPDKYEQALPMVRIVLAGNAPPRHIPGSKERQIPTETAIAFCQTYHLEEAAAILTDYLNGGMLTAPSHQFTSGEIAKKLSVAPRTVSKWIDAYLNGAACEMKEAVEAGNPPPYRLPLTHVREHESDRRVPTSTLRAFCEITGMNAAIPKFDGQPVIFATARENDPDLATFQDIFTIPCKTANSGESCIKTANAIQGLGGPPIIIAHHSIGQAAIRGLVAKYGTNNHIIAIMPPGSGRVKDAYATLPDDGAAGIEAAKMVDALIKETPRSAMAR